MLTINELAEKLNVALSTVRGWVYDGSIPVHKLGNNKRSIIRFDPDELNEWYMKTKKVNPKKVDLDRVVESEFEIKSKGKYTSGTYDEFLKNLQRKREAS